MTMPVRPAQPVPPPLPARESPPLRDTYRETLRPGPSRLALLVQTWGLGAAAVALTVAFLYAVSDLVARLA